MFKLHDTKKWPAIDRSLRIVCMHKLSLFSLSCTSNNGRSVMSELTRA